MGRGASVPRPWARSALIALTLAYFAAIALHATPLQLVPAALRPARHAVWKAFVGLRLDCGQAVFNSRYGRLKRRHACIAVIGEDASGRLFDLHRTFGDCRPPAVRFRTGAVDLFHYRLLANAMGALILYPERRAAAVEAEPLRRLCRHYCETERPPVRRVHVTWLVQSIDYETGVEPTRVDHLGAFDCATEDLVRDPTLQVTLTDEGPALVRAPAATAP